MAENENDPDDFEGWEPVETESGDDGNPERDLERQVRKLKEREKKLERWEGEILERREELVEKGEELEERERKLEQLGDTQEQRANALDEREAELEDREAELDTKIATLEEYANKGRTFTRRLRTAAAALLWIAAVASVGLAVFTFLFAGPDGYYLVERSSATVLAVVFVVVAAVEVVGGYLAYTGRRWWGAVVAGILGTMVVPPVGVAATVMLTVGESQFD
jgi:hypothetical protein